MQNATIITSRDTGPFRGKYWVRTAVKRVVPDEGESYLVARAEIFDVPPYLGKPYRVAVGSNIRVDDVLDMMQNAERIARDTIHRFR